MIDWGTVLPIALGIVGSIVGALAYRDRQGIVIKLARVQNEATQKRLELERVQNEAHEFQALMRLINSQSQSLQLQIEVNGQMRDMIKQVADDNENNYRVQQMVWDRRAAEIMGNSRKARDEIMQRMDKLPGEIAEANVRVLSEVARELGQEIGVVIREAMGLRDMTKKAADDEANDEAKGNGRDESSSSNVDSGDRDEPVGGSSRTGSRRRRTNPPNAGSSRRGTVPRTQ